MLPIGLLSGGQRTMCALALLFAVFQARPSPFCLLDEVDAALDDLNISRFLAMLEGFQRGSQFVVVTHNKGTMAACDELYGITMEVRGVSRHVSVELSNVERLVPDAQGSFAAARGVSAPAPAEADDASAEVAGEPVRTLVPPAPAGAGAD